jgi:hypothetical protein
MDDGQWDKFSPKCVFRNSSGLLPAGHQVARRASAKARTRHMLFRWDSCPLQLPDLHTVDTWMSTWTCLQIQLAVLVEEGWAQALR